jgi:hypothetical protein
MSLFFEKKYFMGQLGHSLYCCFVHKTLLWRVLGLIYTEMKMSHFMSHLSEP